MASGGRWRRRPAAARGARRCTAAPAGPPPRSSPERGSAVALSGASSYPDRRSGALQADLLTVRPGGELAAVVHQETAHAAELVGLHRYDRHGQLLAGQVRAGQFEVLGGLGLVDVDPRGLRRRTACRQFLQVVVLELDGRPARRVVVDGLVHGSAPPGWVQCVTTVDPKGRVRGPTRPILLLVAHARVARGRPRAPLPWCVGALPPEHLAVLGP